MNRRLYHDTAVVKRQTWICPALLVLGAVVYALIKYGGPVWVRFSVEQGQVHILNRMLSLEQIRWPLNVYLGLAEEKIFGPASQAIAAGLFMLFSVTYLRGASAWRFFIFASVFLLLTKPEVLTFQPYGDAIGGPFAEAIWLKRKQFNYAGLLRQPDYADGGPRVYVFSIFPGYLALFMAIFRKPAVYLALLHVNVFMMMAAVMAWLREIVRREFDDDLAIVMTVVFVFAPLVQAQTEALNMEAPCLFFMMMSAFFLSRKAVVAAAVAAVIAVFTKGLGVMACGAVGLATLFLWIWGRSDKKPYLQYCVVIISMVLIPVVMLFLKYYLNDAHVSAGMVSLWTGWPSLNNSFIFNAFWMSLVVYVISLLLARRPFEQWFFPSGVMYLYGIVYFFVMLNFFAVSNRYRLGVYPFLIFSMFYSLALIIRAPVLRRWVLVIAALVCAFSSYGFFYGRGVEHIVLERSLEYRNDLYLDRELAGLFETKYASFKIGAPMVMAQTFALPELGYTQKKLHILIYGFSCTYGGIQEFMGLRYLNLNKTIFVAKRKDNEMGNVLVPYPIDDLDRVIDIISFGDKKAWLFMGGIAIEKMYNIVHYIKYYTIHRDDPGKQK